MKKFRVRIEIRLKPGILDAEGRTIERAIRRFGIEATNTRKGKLIEFDIKGKNKREVIPRIQKLAKDFLINPLTEEFTMEIKGEEA